MERLSNIREIGPLTDLCKACEFVECPLHTAAGFSKLPKRLEEAQRDDRQAEFYPGSNLDRVIIFEGRDEEEENGRTLEVHRIEGPDGSYLMEGQCRKFPSNLTIGVSQWGEPLQPITI